MPTVQVRVGIDMQTVQVRGIYANCAGKRYICQLFRSETYMSTAKVGDIYANFAGRRLICQLCRSETNMATVQVVTNMPTVQTVN